MKHFRPLLLALVLLLGASTVSAQAHHDKHHGGKECDESTKAFVETARKGFQQAPNPQFIFTAPNNKFMLGLGATVTLRSSYDFMGAMGNIDFVPYDIPMTKGYANQQRVMMDASTSRIFLKGIINSERLGRIVAFTDIDFRGGDAFSYIPRLRSAYVQVMGFTVGRDVTTFCDLMAAPTTIDFQGPNAYNFRFTEMIRYEHTCWDKHITFGAALEVPIVNATYGENFSAIYQRVPDGIAYLQYAWGEKRSSHIRLSGVIRDMYLHDNRLGKNTTQLGWGAQLSGHIEIGKWVDLYMNGVYGRGITPYINDLMGSGLDFTPRPNNPTKVQATPMFGWQAAAQINILDNLFVSGGYSAVTVRKKNGVYSDDMYKQGQYIFGNVFWNLTPRFVLGAEYLYAHRKNMDGLKAHSNRINLLAKYSF